jgi:hypothetical protein
MMTREDIRTELGWTDDMIHSLLQIPDSPNVRRCKYTGAYTYGLYKRERVLAVAQTTEGSPRLPSSLIRNMTRAVSSNRTSLP